MQRLDIVEPVSEPTDWVNHLITVDKPNGELGICLDPKYLSQAIRGQHCKLPPAEERFSEMHNAEFFTKLDVGNGYWQIKVDEESSELLTFWHPLADFDLSVYVIGYIVQMKCSNSSLRKFQSVRHSHWASLKSNSKVKFDTK